MDFETQQTVNEWNREVEAEMRKLIREGTPPFDAAGEARRLVSQRRRIDALIAQGQETRLHKEIDDPIFKGPNAEAEVRQ